MQILDDVKSVNQICGQLYNTQLVRTFLEFSIIIHLLQFLHTKLLSLSL